jgi:rod shape-determining protein MreC
LLGLLKKKSFLLLLITVLILVVIGLSSNETNRINWLDNAVSIVLTPLQKVFLTSGQKVQDSMSFFKDIKAVKQENDDLKVKIDKLEKENAELIGYREKIKELQDALNLKDQFNDYEMIGANIIGKDAGNWFNVFNVDRGTRDGIFNNYPVITGKGLVGRVSNADLFSSKVISIIDPDSTVSGRISRTRDTVLVRGDLVLRDQGLCRMDHISPDVDVSFGDTIETSGIGGIYPKGIIIGKVKSVSQKNSEMTRYAIIEPAVDFKRMEEVFILKAKTK